MYHIADRFRGYLPVVVDIETGGFDHTTDALLEIACVLLRMDAQGMLHIDTSLHAQVEPFSGATISQASLDFTGINPSDPERQAISEQDLITQIFQPIRQAIKAAGCKKAIMTGHNTAFDLNFLNALVDRLGYKRNPFHPFSTFDTVTLAGLACGQTVLAKACKVVDIDFDNGQAHNALYDATKTAELFCLIVNQWPYWPRG